ncbi:MAG: phage head-tail connector protein [Ruminococcus sp.]|nr:phage head-tail connector protein [Ruminococcus sp.]
MAEVFDILSRVKTNLGITGEFQDGTLMGYIEEVKDFLLDAGVKPETVNSGTSAGIITRGVADLWNYGSGNADFSPYFRQRAIQLSYREADSDVKNKS